jgi:[ribosomal protein S18]-alanine N-acetyltransferase
MVRFTGGIELFEERRKLICHVLVEQIKSFFTYDADRQFYAKIFPGSVDPESLKHIRKMKTTDIDSVLAIEQSVYKYPWTRGILVDCMVVPGYHCWVCEDEHAVFGYAVLAIGVDEAHIMNLCVSSDAQGEGWGARLLEEMIGVAQEKPIVDTLLLEVRKTNKSAIGLYKKYGFKKIGERKAYYPTENGRENAVMFALTVS